MGLTTEQANLAMVIASKISGALSIIGSSFIVRDVYKRWRIKAGRANNNEKLATTTFLVLSMSVADLGSSFFAYFLGSWMAPREGGFPGAAGNGATCTAQAFMFGMFFSAGGLSNGTLSLTCKFIIRSLSTFVHNANPILLSHILQYYVDHRLVDYLPQQARTRIKNTKVDCDIVWTSLVVGPCLCFGI